MRAEPVGPNLAMYQPSLQTAFYPGASTRAEAEIIALAPADERTRIDFVIPGGRSMGTPFNALLQMPIVSLPEAAAAAAAGVIIRGRVVSTDGQSAFRRRAPVR